MSAFHLIKVRALKLKPGEGLIDKLDNVEDSKGNSGNKGSLFVTNMRLIWKSDNSEFSNLCMYHAVVVNTYIGIQIVISWIYALKQLD